MNYQVVESFKDKHTGEIYSVGAILELTEERVAEINTVEKKIKRKLIKKTKATSNPEE